MNAQSSTCDGCYWRDVCSDSCPCEYYYSTDVENDDTIIQAFIEEERIQFRREWSQYIRDFE